MGCCLSCLESKGAGTKESEMTSSAASQQRGKSMAISRKMSAPSIAIEDKMKVSGNGLALAGVSIEQDAAYWEWHVEIPDGTLSADTMFGIATAKDRAFYQKLEEQDDATPQTDGTALMRKVPISTGDTVGVAVQQSDLPMVQFLVNGELLHELAINRFRGAVFPSIRLPTGESIIATLVLDEEKFEQMSPHARFGPVIVSRGII